MMTKYMTADQPGLLAVGLIDKLSDKKLSDG